MTLIESLFDLIAKLQLERPLPTTLHVRFASVERMQAPDGGVDSATLGARLKSGSPFRNVFMRCDDLDRAAHTAHDLRIAVHALADVRESATDALLLRQLSPYASTIGEPYDLAPSVSVESFGPIVLLVSALWGRVGSSTIFDAQTRYLIGRGCIVVRVLVEHHPHHGEERIKRTTKFLSETFNKVRPHLHFIADRNQGFRHLSELAASSDFRDASPVRRVGLLLADAKSDDQPGLCWFAEKAAFAVVNHLPHVEFTNRLTKAPLILETHDIYSKLLSTHGVPRFVPPGPDGPDLRLVEESTVWKSVAGCVNLSPDDHEVIKKHAALAVLARPYVARRSLTRRSWPEVLAANGLPDSFTTANEFDLMLWGSWHDGNVASVLSFLKVVAQDERLTALKILVVGRVISGLPSSLQRRTGLYLTGHVDTLDDFIARSRILVIPDQDGTGISIKALDAFALGCCFAATRPALRGIDLGDTGYQPSANAKELADDVAALLDSHSAREKRVLIARRLYDLNYSRTVYSSAWDTMLSAVVPGLQPKKHSVLEQDEEATTRAGPKYGIHPSACDALVPNRDGDASPMSEAQTNRSPRLSVAVCTYNRYDVLPDAIDSLLKQACEPDFLDIIVIDNSPDQLAAERFSQRYASEPRIRYVLEHVPGLSNARNRAAALARADLIAFMDDDAIAAPNWSTSIVRAFEVAGERAAVIGGRVLPRWIGSKPTWLSDDLLKYLTIIDWGGRFRELPPHQWLAGCNITFDKSALAAVGGFSRALGRIGSGLSLLSNDETDVMEKINATGRISMYCPDAVVEHIIDPARLTQSWFRRRAAWQAVSEFIKDPEQTTAYAPAAAEHMRLVLRNGLRESPMGFFRRVEDPNEFKHDVALIYDLVVATLAGGVEIDPAPDQGTVAALKSKAIGTMRLAAQKNRSVREMLHLALRVRGLFFRGS
jgi:GT2 family glycosyltransferase